MKKFGWLLGAAAAFMAPVAAFAHGVPLEEQQRLIEGGNLAYLRSGAIHMITGYDHLLFLAGVVVFLNSFRDIVKFVTVFTVGHSITLISATLLGITADYYLVDAVIGASVIYIGFANLGGFQKYLDMAPPNLLAMVFGLGLIHGFGLSTRLQQLPLPEDGLIWRIVSFNVGIELGQVAALSVILAAVALWRGKASFATFSKITNGVIVISGVLLVLMQLHGYSHIHYAEELGFNEDGHAHSHADMERAKVDALKGERESIFKGE